jgi:hypothetical protein
MMNRVKASVDGREYELEASLLAADYYADEFAGNLKAPYRGVLEDDMLVTYNRSRPTVEAFVMADDKGKPVKDDDGNLIPVEHGGVKADVPNKMYRGVDGLALVRYVWAMGAAAGSIDERWEDFFEHMSHVDFSAREMAQLFLVVIMDLGGCHIFRNPEGHADAVDADDGQAAAGGSADAGGDGVAD